MIKQQTLDVMLDMALQHISQLIEFCDVNGYGQKSQTLNEAREFEDEFMKYIRYRKCCATCAHYRRREYETGVTSQSCTESYAFAPVVSIPDNADPGIHGMNCMAYACKYEDIRKPRKKVLNGKENN